MSSTGLPAGVEVELHGSREYGEILTPEALAFVAGLQRRHNQRRLELLAARKQRQQRIASGESLDFLPETADVRESEWMVARPAPGLSDRRVEITGPTDAKMAINALNSNAKVWLADFEDANTPLWENMIGGQYNLRAAVDGELEFSGTDGRQYRLKDRQDLATIVVRPRGWHLSEKHLLVDGERTAAAIVDFGLYFFHCAQRQLDNGLGPYFYLPKMESHLEARLWNDIFLDAQAELGIARGTIRATVLVETVPAAFEMDEILYELREHAAGLNAGRWDYLFSLIKTFRSRGGRFVLPDRNTVTMTAPMMRAYTRLLVQTCHRRGAHAIGGMAAFIPNRRDPEVNARALAAVRADKDREAADGFDGSWVAHPDLVPICSEAFTAVLGDKPDQRDRPHQWKAVAADEILNVAATPGQVTEAGLRGNISVALQYLATWLRGTGAVAIANLMEDAATAEICRSQIWQWVHNEVTLADGPVVSAELVDQLANEELANLGDAADYAPAWQLFREVALADDFPDFLTIPAYERMP